MGMATDFAIIAFFYMDGVEVHCQCIESEHTVCKQFASPQQIFQSLSSLNGASDTCNRTENAYFIGSRYTPVCRLVSEEAAVTGGAGQMGECLALKSQDATVGKRFIQHHARIINQKFGLEVVRGINDEVPLLDNLLCIVCIQKEGIGSDLYIWIKRQHFLFGALHFGFTHIFGKVNHLSLQVTYICYICIYKTYMSDACCCQI